MHRQTLAQSHSSIQWASGSWKKSWLIPPLPVGTKTCQTHQAGELYVPEREVVSSGK